jgi:translation initiation factor 3 subunit E
LQLKLVAANKWNVPHLATLGISAEIVEMYRSLARFHFDCGDYRASGDILANYISLFATPPPPTSEEEDEYGEAAPAPANQHGRHQQQQQSAASTTHPDGTPIGNASMYYLRSVLWGRLACEILVEEYAAAAIGLEAVKAALESLAASNAVSALEALQQRTWVMHWSLFVYWNDTAAPAAAAAAPAAAPASNSGKKAAAQAAAAAAAAAQASAGGLEQLVELFHSERYRQAITTNAPHLLRYLTAAVLLCKRRVVGKKATAAHSAEARRLLKNLIYVIQDCEYTDPIVEFVNCLIVKFDFDSAQVKLGECERVLSNDFFLCHQTDLFMEEARVFVFENYCRIHTKIDLRALGDKLAMDQEQAERWIVDLIRNADLDAKIDADQGCVIMGGTPQSIYEQVMDRTRDLNLRSATLTQNLSRMLNEARKEKAKRERAAKSDDEY